MRRAYTKSKQWNGCMLKKIRKTENNRRFHNIYITKFQNVTIYLMFYFDFKLIIVKAGHMSYSGQSKTRIAKMNRTGSLNQWVLILPLLLPIPLSVLPIKHGYNTRFYFAVSQNQLFLMIYWKPNLLIAYTLFENLKFVQ